MSSAVYRAWQAGRHMGVRWVVYRLSYAARLRTGQLRRQTPAEAWDDHPLAGDLRDARLADPAAYLEYRRVRAPRFFFDPHARSAYCSLFGQWDADASPLLESDALAGGRLRYFGHAFAEVGNPPIWHTNPFTGERVPAGRHWSEIGDFGHGDIKLIWEPSRFGFVFALVRAYWRTGDERYAEQFWRLAEDWRAHNLPQCGPNWKCGQEASFRAMAWCFGLYGFLHAQVTSAERVAMLAQMVASSGRRIAANLSYALSQRNNHGISEAVGLWTIGVLFPELRAAAAWRVRGRQVLEDLARDLIYDDGAFVQHSMNYHRLMLHDYIWAIRLADLHDEPFSNELKARVGKAADFLYQVQDATSGQVPNYGHNDGALILPLSNCDYRDFRPVVQAARYLVAHSHSYAAGAWDEDLLWLFGPQALKAPLAPPPRADMCAEAGGYYTLHAGDGHAFIRCATFRDRPSQADMLHLDLWWRGQNIALDPGTYSYNAPAPWNNALAHTTCHNTVTVDDLDQMDQAGKFLWLPWIHARATSRPPAESESLPRWVGEHDGYMRLKAPASHQREVHRLSGERWLVRDTLASKAAHQYRLHWLIADLPYEWDAEQGRLQLHTPAGRYYLQIGAVGPAVRYSLVRASPGSSRGWCSPYYYARQPALSIDATVEASSAQFWTLFSPEPCRVVVESGDIHIEI